MSHGPIIRRAEAKPILCLHYLGLAEVPGIKWVDADSPEMLRCVNLVCQVQHNLLKMLVVFILGLGGVVLSSTPVEAQAIEDPKKIKALKQLIERSARFTRECEDPEQTGWDIDVFWDLFANKAGYLFGRITMHEMGAGPPLSQEYVRDLYQLRRLLTAFLKGEKFRLWKESKSLKTRYMFKKGHQYRFKPHNHGKGRRSSDSFPDNCRGGKESPLTKFLENPAWKRLPDPDANPETEPTNEKQNENMDLIEPNDPLGIKWVREKTNDLLLTYSMTGPPQLKDAVAIASIGIAALAYGYTALAAVVSSIVCPVIAGFEIWQQQSVPGGWETALNEKSLDQFDDAGCFCEEVPHG